MNRSAEQLVEFSLAVPSGCFVGEVSNPCGVALHITLFTLGVDQKAPDVVIQRKGDAPEAAVIFSERAKGAVNNTTLSNNVEAWSPKGSAFNSAQFKISFPIGCRITSCNHNNDARKIEFGVKSSFVVQEEMLPNIQRMNEQVHMSEPGKILNCSTMSKPWPK
ncbi:MAG: hypothetical protein V4490_04970 [Pseudomonadota bacterium]